MVHVMQNRNSKLLQGLLKCVEFVRHEGNLSSCDTGREMIKTSVLQVQQLMQRDVLAREASKDGHRTSME